MRNFIALVSTAALAICLHSCSEPLLVSDIQNDNVVSRSECSRIGQSYLTEVRLLMAASLEVPSQSVVVAGVIKVSTSSAILIESSSLIDTTVSNFSDILFIGYCEDPESDTDITGYYFDDGYCDMPSNTKIVVGSLQEVLTATINVFDENVDGL